MGVLNYYLDTILVPLSLFLTIGYHVFLWHNFKNNPSVIILGLDSLKRRQWLKAIKPGDDKNEILAVQTLRNTLMETILTSTITLLIIISLAALSNNAYKGSNLMSQTPVFGSQSGRIIVLKYGLALIFLLTSFFCSSIAVAYIVDSNFLINTLVEFSGRAHVRIVLERGFIMGIVGSRMLCIGLTLLLWLFGPVFVVVSSLGLIWALYGLDYANMAHYMSK